MKSYGQCWAGLVFEIGETKNHVTNPGQDWYLKYIVLTGTCHCSEASESPLGMTIYGSTSFLGEEYSGASESSLGMTLYGNPSFFGKENSEASESSLGMTI